MTQGFIFKRKSSSTLAIGVSVHLSTEGVSNPTSKRAILNISRFLEKLKASLPKRMEAVMKVRDGHAEYQKRDIFRC